MDEEKLLKILKDVEFTEGESKVYLSLLKVGESKVGPIIRSSKISRSKVYDILDRLVKKSVVSSVEKKGGMFYQALPPHSLLNIIKMKERRLKQEEDMLKEIIPNLLELKPKQKTNVVIYQGYDGFKAMIDRTIDELTSKDAYEAMGISETTGGMRHYARKVYEIQRKKKFKARSVFDEKGVFKAAERKTPLHKIRVLPKGWNTPALFTIYGDTVGIHLGENEEIVSIVIENKNIAKSFRATFEAMWRLGKDI